MTDFALRQPGRLIDLPGREIIGGKIVTMAPASPNHQMVTFKVNKVFDSYLEGKSCKAFYDVYVNLGGDKVAPDITVVCNPEIIKKGGIYGAPDLVAEILSPSTSVRDRHDKKNIYEKGGVKEYWIVDAKNLSIEVYHLMEGKYVLNGFYVIHDDFDLEVMTQEERDNVGYTFKTSIFDDLVIDIREIFKDLLP
jgi:Uma2 family endonuclease